MLEASSDPLISAENLNGIKLSYLHTLRLVESDGTLIQNLTGYYEHPVNVAPPTKPGYTFAGWTPTLPATFMEDATFTAQRTKNPTPPTPPTSSTPGNGGYSGGGGSYLTKDHCPNGDFSPSYYDKTCGVAQEAEHPAP